MLDILNSFLHNLLSFIFEGTIAYYSILPTSALAASPAGVS
jgi:hypothetical protein